MQSLTVGSTTVEVTRNLPDPILDEREGRSSVVVLTQPGATLHADHVADQIRSEGYAVEVIGLPDRDEAKTLAVAAALYDRLAHLGFTRDDTVVGVGGGSVTDLAGFVAGTWMRGVEVVHVPTTLLGAVDAAIGGKTGINLSGKNLVGVFWPPTKVVVDLEILANLPSKLVLEGLSEAFKAGLIGDVELFETIESAGVDAPLEKVVPAAIAVKARYVMADPKESGERAMLNFGHTVGHAIEYSSALSHGLSVGVGMLAATALSEKLVGFAARDRVDETIFNLGLAPDVSGLDRKRVEDLLGLDKKRDAAGLRMVLLKDLGEPVLAHIDDPSAGFALDAIGL